MTRLAFTPALAGTDASSALMGLADTLARAGATFADVAAIAAGLPAGPALAELAAAWRARFPDPLGAPALRVTRTILPPGAGVTLQATLAPGTRRAAFGAAGGEAAGLAPGIVRAGALLVTSSVDGCEPDGTVATAADAEIERAFAKVDALVAQAGGSSAGILHFWAFAAPGIVATDFTPPWLRRFPLAGDRPARKTFLRAPFAGPGRIVMQATAIAGGARRTNVEVAGARHRDPLPMGARAGTLFMSSGILANAPDPADPAGLGSLPVSPAAQAAQAFANLAELLRAAGGSLAHVALLGALLNDGAALAAFTREFEARYPAATRPPWQRWSMPTATPEQHVQLFATAVFPAEA